MSDSTPSLSPASSPPSSLPSTPPNLHQNSIDPDSKWLVQKYGGTSVGKFATKIAADIVSNYIDSNKVVVVCSARSGSTKALGTTNLLLRCASEALVRSKKSAPSTAASGTGTGTHTPTSSGIFGRARSSPPLSPGGPSTRSDSVSSVSFTPFSSLSSADESLPAFNTTVDLIRAEHYAAAAEHVRDPEILNALKAEIDADCDWLRSFLFASRVINEISPRAKDSIVGLGERMACKLMTAVLHDNGIDAEYVSLEDIVPLEWAEGGEDGVLGQDFYDAVAQAVGERVKQCGSRVPVVTGFYGPVPGSLLAQVGRGYTDLLAALTAVGLEASELQIWKEVDGIFTADPRKVSTARVIPIISPDEAAELTYYGSEVVHPFTMEQVIRRKIPIRIKNVENPVGGGTVIYPDYGANEGSGLAEDGSEGGGGGNGGIGAREAGALPPVPEPMTPGALERFSSTGLPHRRLPTAVTIKEHIVVINVNSNRKSVSHGFLASLFRTLDRFGVVVDLVSTSEVHVSMAIEDHLERRLFEKLLKELRKSGSVSVHEDMAILSLVGRQMRHMVGIAGRMFSTLAQGNINMEMISQGASEINISCVIQASDAVKALNLIHQSCLQIAAQGRLGPWLF